MPRSRPEAARGVKLRGSGVAEDAEAVAEVGHGAEANTTHPVTRGKQGARGARGVCVRIIGACDRAGWTLR